jgi:hypothetical protein
MVPAGARECVAQTSRGTKAAARTTHTKVPLVGIEKKFSTLGLKNDISFICLSLLRK